MKPAGFDLDRRSFLGTVGAAGAVALARRAASAQAGPEMVTPKAPDGQVLRAGLVGCGGRGTGAAQNFLESASNLKIVALADVFPDRIAEARKRLAKSGQDIPESRCFVGFDAVNKLLNSGVDIMLNATPPHFRPAHFALAVEAGKNCFLEKPISVDAPGARSVSETAKKAKEKGLSVVTGTQMRYDNARIETQRRVAGGEIGDIVALRTFRNQGALWYREREPQWSDMEYMIRDWVNWIWLSGDHIVEQHIHHLDQALWFAGAHPVKAVGMGGRARRMTGDQYDFFSIDYEFPNRVHMHSTIRQLNGCANVREEIVVGTKGIANTDGTILDLKGNVIWRYEGPRNNFIVSEHVALVTAIRTGKPINTTEATVESTLMAIMGRDSAYSGKEVTWDGLLASTTRLGPTEYALGPVAIRAEVPVPGVAGARSRNTAG